jgi:hypothetical protein
MLFFFTVYSVEFDIGKNKIRKIGHQKIYVNHLSQFAYYPHRNFNQHSLKN